MTRRRRRPRCLGKPMPERAYPQPVDLFSATMALRSAVESWCERVDALAQHLKTVERGLEPARRAAHMLAAEAELRAALAIAALNGGRVEISAASRVLGQLAKAVQP